MTLLFGREELLKTKVERLDNKFGDASNIRVRRLVGRSPPQLNSADGWRKTGRAQTLAPPLTQKSVNKDALAPIHKFRQYLLVFDGQHRCVS